MRDIVLVHGAWHGGWCWAETAALLRAAGHRVHAPTLSGLAERAHTFDAQIGLRTHVEDIVRLVDFEALDDFVLVGHSYAGNVITGVGDRLRERVAHYVFLDAVVPPDDARQWCWADFSSPAARAQRIETIDTDGRGLMLPPPPPEAFGIADPSMRAHVGARLTPMPAATYLEPIHLRAGGTSGLRRSYVAAAAPAYAPMSAVVERLRDAPDWHFETIAAGHDMMIDAPAVLAARLAEFAAD